MGTTLAAAGIFVAPTALLDAHPNPIAAPCYNGVLPWNPYLQSCSLPSVQPRIPGAAPGPGALIACRNHPGCLTWYVNNP